MSDNGNHTGTLGIDVAPYDVLERDLNLGIGLAEARTYRLMTEIFSKPHTAANGIRKLMRARDLEYVIERLQDVDSLRNLQTFGLLRCDPFVFWRRRAVHAALRELPEALRDLKHLNDRLGDVKRARANLVARPRVREDERERELRAPQRNRTR